MAFKKMEKQPYPPRLWALMGFPGSGKSTFATQMRGPLLVIDADQRFGEVLALTDHEVYQLSEVASDNSDPERVAALLEENMPGTAIKTIVVDSLTTIIAPLVTRAVLDNDAGRNKNRMAAFKDKALAMRLFQDSATKWGTDVLWIYHLQQGRDANANEQTTATISRTERARLLRSLNLQLEVVLNGERRGIRVIWARRGRAHPEVPVLWDESGTWSGMPERIEAAVYDGLSEQERNAIQEHAPQVFATPEAAMDWGVEQGAFQALQHARNAYDKLRREQQPQSAEEMAALWVTNVEYRLAAAQEEEAEKDLGEEAQQEASPSPSEILDRHFPREDAGYDNAADAGNDVESAGSDDSSGVDASAFWTEFYTLKAQGKLTNTERLKQADEVKQAQQDNDWSSALYWLRTQVRG